MTQQEQIEAVKRYIRLTRRNLYHTREDAEEAEYEELGRELAMIRGDQLIRLIAHPAEVGTVVKALRS